MRRMTILAAAALLYTSSAFAADATTGPAQPRLAVADCGERCAADEVAPVQGARDASACSGSGCAAADGSGPRITCDDDHPCFDP